MEGLEILSQSSLLVAVTSFALGISVLARNVRNKLFMAFAVLTSLLSVWALAFFLERIWGGGGFYRLHLFANVWLGPAALGFIHIMVRIQDVASRRLFDLSLILALSLSAALALRMESKELILQLIYFSPITVILQTLQLMWIDRRLRRGFKRLPKLPTVGFGKRNFIYLGALVVMCTTVMDHVPWLGNAVPSFGNLTLAGYLFFISQAISQQRLLNFGALFSRILVLVAVALTLTGVYSLLVGWIQNSPGLFFLNSFIASFLILTLLDPLRSVVRYFTQRLLTQKHLRLEQTLREAQRRLAGIVDLGSLFQSVLLTTEQVLQPEWGAFFVLRSDGTKYRRVRTMGTEPILADSSPGSGGGPLRELLVDHPLLKYCELLKKRGELPVLLDQVLENEIDRLASRVQREYFLALIQGLKALGVNLLIPLLDSEKILGFIALRVPGPPEPWGNNWGLLTVVYPYYEQVALAMRSMEIFVRQREKERLATLGEMAAGLAHEIRNPLGAIKGAAQFLDPASDRPDSKFLRVIIEEADRLNRVVTRFLDYSKPANLDFKTLDLSVLAEKTVEMMRSGLKPGVSLEFFPAKNAATVLASSEQLHQVLVNFIRNSMHALEGKPDGSIQVRVEKDGSGAREVSLTVEDNGKGIRREHLDKLFIPFFTTSPSGTGLGLSISQKIIEAHRGRIEVNSEEGRFTKFSVILPYMEGVT